MPDIERILSSLPAELSARVSRHHDLRHETSLRVGGPADIFCQARTPEEARRFQELAREAGIPFFVMGSGSNILADDRGFPGLVLKVRSTDFEAQGAVVRVGAGLEFDELVRLSLESGLVGLEFASGIPGTVGGAVMGNAGCYGHEIGEFVREAVTLHEDGRILARGPEDFGFRYRATDLRESGEILLSVVLELSRGDTQEALAERRAHIADRHRKHPIDLPSAGSWFRNLPPEEPGGRRRAAGQLLEEAGAKEFVEGDARVFEKHANMIVNAGRATSDQVRTLARRMREAVRERFGVELIQEVRYLGPDPDGE